MTDPILHVHVGKPVTDSLARAARTMEALERGDAVTPYFSIGFADIGDLLAVLTLRRWQVLRVLREQGSASIAELADRLGEDADSLTGDIDTLSTWSLIEQDTAGRIRAPYRELVVEVKFPVAKAA